MKPHNRPTRDALARMRAALLDLMQAERFTEANELAALIERIEPPVPVTGEAAGSGYAGTRTGRPDSATHSPAASGPATYMTNEERWLAHCDNCGESIAKHCTTHLLPCCPGSLMHGQDEGTWTPSANPSV